MTDNEPAREAFDAWVGETQIMLELDETEAWSIFVEAWRSALKWAAEGQEPAYCGPDMDGNAVYLYRHPAAMRVPTYEMARAMLDVDLGMTVLSIEDAEKLLRAALAAQEI